jgi:hypothetical protein
VNDEALAVTITAMRDAGRITPADEATVAAAESLALAVDAAPGEASLWREYRAALKSLTELGAVDDGGDDIGQLLEALRGGASVVDAKD